MSHLHMSVKDTDLECVIGVIVVVVVVPDAKTTLERISQGGYPGG